MLSNHAVYSLGVCDKGSAGVSVKEAMLITQKEAGGKGLAHIYRLFSLVEFAGHELSDAIDYFTFAIEFAEKSKNEAELAITAYYAAGAHFIFGNISKAERLILQAENAALAAGRAEWADRSRFLHGRLRFEMGRYKEALEIFSDLQSNLQGNLTGEGYDELKATISAWIYRTNIYLGMNSGSANEKGIDAKLFEIEAAFLAGNYTKTLELAKTMENTLSGDRFLLLEQPDWSSGFAQCELLLFPLKDLWDRMVLTYKALALCHMHGSAAGDREEAIRDMQRIMRDELPDTDPNDAFYFYSFYRVLKQTGAPEVDMNTAISLAFKRLQRRASRIDDNETKRSFLSFPYWNSSLAVAAKEHKLI
jgi:tetratricopeptide (TPR) repeat protein